jgi:hypothetical protein
MEPESWQPSFFRPDRKISAGVTDSAATQQPGPMIANRAVGLSGKELLKLTNAVLMSSTSPDELRDWHLDAISYSLQADGISPSHRSLARI